VIRFAEHGMGWLPDYPIQGLFRRSLTRRARGSRRRGARIPSMHARQGGRRGIPEETASSIRRSQGPGALRRDHGSLGSCTGTRPERSSNLRRKAFGKHIDVSLSFLYKATRNLMSSKGDTGAFLRTTIGRARTLRAAAEEHWLLSRGRFDVEPTHSATPSLRTIARSVTIVSIRPERRGRSSARIKTNLAAALPSMFGFTVYSSIGQAGFDRPRAVSRRG